MIKTFFCVLFLSVALGLKVPNDLRYFAVEDDRYAATYVDRSAPNELQCNYTTGNIAGDGYCSCECDVPDPDCQIGLTYRVPINCPTTLIGSVWCLNNMCTPAPVPATWNSTVAAICNPANYNDTQLCNCGCGAYDPDCDDTSLLVLGCFGQESPRCAPPTGVCTENYDVPQEIGIGCVLPVTAICGRRLVHVLLNNEGTIPLLVSVNNYAGSPIMNDQITQDYVLTAKVKSVTNGADIQLTGSLTTTVKGGAAYFPKLIAMGPADAEFKLEITSDPPLVPFTTPFTIKLSPGETRDAETYWDPNLSYRTQEGHLVVPTGHIILGWLSAKDGCGNLLLASNSAPFECIVAHYDSDNLLQFDYDVCLGVDPNTRNGDKQMQTALDTRNLKNGTYILVYFVTDGFLSLHVETMEVTPEAEFNCYSSTDPKDFEQQMIDPSVFLQLGDLALPGNDIPQIITFNFTQHAYPSYYTALSTEHSTWQLAAKRFFLEQDPNFLTVISVDLISVTEVTINIVLQKPFCGSFTTDQQKNVIGRFLYRVGGELDSIHSASSTATSGLNSSLEYTPPLEEIVCYGKGTPNHLCCDQMGYVNEALSPCSEPTPSSTSKALLAISIVFAIIASLYATILVGVFIQQSGAIFTVIEDYETMSKEERASRGRFAFVAVIFAPVICILGAIQNSLVVPEAITALALIILVYIPVIVTWWISGIWRYFVLFWAFGLAPPRKIDILYFVSLLAIIFVSLFNVFWTFCWVTLGLMLNPDKVVSYFVAFLTVFLVAFVKISSLMAVMKEAEKQLHVVLIKLKLGRGVALSDEDIAETIQLSADKLREHLLKKGIEPKDVEEMMKKITSFRRFRVKFIAGNLVGSILVLTALIVFIQLGVEAFRVSGGSGVVSGVGATLNALSGVGIAANQQFSDKKEQIQNLAARFSKTPVANPGLEMQVMQ